MNGKKLISVNPVNGNVIGEYARHNSRELSEIAAKAEKDQNDWQATAYDKRSSLMMKAAENLRQKIRIYSELITTEMGKPIVQSRAEIEKCADVCEYYAEHAKGFLSNENIDTGAGLSYVSYSPLGTVLGVMPWNFPFWQVFRFAAPTLMAGNGILLKHASSVTGCALAIEDLFRDAGLPENLFRVLKLGGSEVATVIENPVVKAVTITGSVQAGKAVAEKAGAMLKKTVLELGGSDPYIILEDADLDAAAKICAAGRLINGGQSCIAAKRFIVVKQVIKEFENRFVAEMKDKKMGDPMDEQNDLGPQASVSLRNDLHRQVLRSIGEGAECLLGGEIPSGEGAFYPPTVLARVRPGMPAYEEEIFGPVAAIIEADNQQDAIRIANDTAFGLGAAIFSRDIERAAEIAEIHLQAGSCFVNDMVRSDPRLPFGGIKNSGYGRELSWFGIREFTNIKTVFVK